MPINIGIGSKSAIKTEAACAACRAASISATIVCHSVGSDVRAQPLGREETLRGARNRARGARAQAPTSWGLGIENGIVHEGGRWHDLAAVVIIAPDGRETVRWSTAVAFPDEYVKRAEDAGFDRVTVGATIAEALGTPPDDPHREFGERRPRKEILAAAIAEALIAAMGKGDEAMKNVHRIEVGGVVRELPIREVAPGVRVALFNILGDWLLAEAAGKELAIRLPRGVDALVMPDGKATALLHVMGRFTGLPTFVARKEKKPYMAEPVVSTTYRSITTNREQTLFLGAEDAAKLPGARVVIVDDVVSTGGTLVATKALMAEVGAEVVGVAAVFTEGGAREDVISLGDLPLY